MMHPKHCAAALVLLLATGAASAQTDSKQDEEEKKTRVGTCQDARSQMEYFCNKDNSAGDSMVQMGTACPNAKNNVKEACEGIVAADIEYKFDDKK